MARNRPSILWSCGGTTLVAQPMLAPGRGCCSQEERCCRLPMGWLAKALACSLLADTEHCGDLRPSPAISAGYSHSIG